MSFGQDIGGATLAFVTRVVEGPITMETTAFNPDTSKNEKTKVEVEEPVIVFFPNGSSQVLPAKQAEKMGYLAQPVILNFEAVDKPDTIAGKFKFAMSEQDRKTYWIQMEQHVISACMRKGGYPIPRNCNVSETSLMFSDVKPKQTRKEKEAA